MAYQSEIEKLEQRFNEKPEQWFAALADAYRKNGDLDFAVEILQTWIPKREGYTSGHIVLGRCYLDKERDSEADATFRKVIELDPENIIALKSLADIATRRESIPEARNWLSRLLEADPMNDEAREALEALPGGPAEAAAETEVSPLVERMSEERESEVELVAEAPMMAEPVGAGDDEPTMLMDQGPSEPAEATADEEATVLEGPDISQIPTAPMHSVEGSTGEEATVAEMSAYGFDSPEEVPPVEPAEGLVTVDGSSDVPVESVPKDSFDEELEWDEGERTSKQITQEDVEAAERERADGLVTVDGASSEATESLDVETYESAIELIEGEERRDVGVSGVFQEDGTDFGAGTLGSAVFAAGEEAPATPEPGATGPRNMGVLADTESPPEQSLDLILPEDVSGDEDVVAEPAAEPDDAVEPVVTQTMAEVYLRQGHVAQAREIYEKLLQHDPGNEDVQRKLAELESSGPAPAPALAPSAEAAAPSSEGAQRFSVALTGGVSARDMLARMAGSTSDVRQARPSVRPAQPGRSSFDDFFGSTPGAEAPAGGAAGDAASPPPDPSETESGEDPGFSGWLKGLKT